MAGSRLLRNILNPELGRDVWSGREASEWLLHPLQGIWKLGPGFWVPWFCAGGRPQAHGNKELLGKGCSVTLAICGSLEIPQSLVTLRHE